MNQQQPIREIPYNYTSFSDREIILRILGRRAWHLLGKLRNKRETGISSHLLLEFLGDIWVIKRNPYIQDDLLENKKRLASLISSIRDRLKLIHQRAKKNPLTLELVEIASDAVQKFSDWFPQQRKLRKRAKRKFRAITRKDNILFDGLARVSHVTDATDWRVELPFVVLTPDTEIEIARLVQVCIELGLTVIPRGGGTGYTGGAIPLDEKTAVINTEKLLFIGEVHRSNQVTNDKNQPVPIIKVGAGVVTKRVSETAQRNGFVFAVDPTSQDASTIGGNVAMNAGGKKAVLWGTTLDNLVSWKMVTPDATWMKVERLNHNLGKIHQQKTVIFKVTRYKKDGVTLQGEAEILNFAGQIFRKRGLGKDVTDKFLGGLPGIQKEGCDGLITSAEFILHTMPKQKRTVCLEFYGNNLRRAVPAIVEIKDYLDKQDNVLLAGLEHLDDRYVKAVKYTPKAARGILPKMILLIDIIGEDEPAVAQAASAVVKLANARDGEGFIAISPAAQHSFWLDRSRTAAIAAHTNAFKINEDVVIPLHNLAIYSEEIERINIRQSMLNKLRIVEAVITYLKIDHPELRQSPHYENSVESDVILTSKIQKALLHLHKVRLKWRMILESFDQIATSCKTLLDEQVFQKLQSNDRLIDVLRRRNLRISYRQRVERPLKEIFAGESLKILRDKLDDIHTKIRASRIFIALHAHAGDGNVHTNIPVNSNDYDMLHEAERIVDEIMALATKLDGVISGEHGIGLTKIQYLSDEAMQNFATYKQKIDPNGHFNRGKLLPNSGLQNAYTPSLRLVEREALLLEHHKLSELNTDIKDCLRCGKCKPVCTTHVPEANLLYSPRDKILATGIIIEAFLYEEQTRRNISLRHFTEMNDVADHCTVCHKCLNPCPVNIDFGDVTMRMRHILRDRGQKKMSLVTWASMLFLNLKNPQPIKIMRFFMIKIGFKAQRLGHQLFKNLGLLQRRKRPKGTTGRPAIKEQVIQFVKNPLPKNIPNKTMRGLLNIENSNEIPILRDPKKSGDAVFYFPGCGSERLFSQVGIATLAMLYDIGTTTVLPPSYLCCGYPQKSGGDTEKGQQISTENRVLFYRIAHALSYLKIKTVIVSCGTCMDQLLEYEFNRIFPDCRLLDIHEYLLEKNVKLNGVKGTQYLYHDPCHTPMKTQEPIKIVSELIGNKVQLTERCCGEAGTFAVSRPDIASQIRFRKQKELQTGIQQLTGKPKAKNNNVKLLTSCPACQQGLARYEKDTGLDVDYIVVEIAKKRNGKNWQQNFIQQARTGGIEKVLL